MERTGLINIKLTNENFWKSKCMLNIGQCKGHIIIDLDVDENLLLEWPIGYKLIEIRNMYGRLELSSKCLALGYQLKRQGDYAWVLNKLFHIFPRHVVGTSVKETPDLN
jgi:hypothetical protein